MTNFNLFQSISNLKTQTVNRDTLLPRDIAKTDQKTIESSKDRPKTNRKTE